MYYNKYQDKLEKNSDCSKYKFKSKMMMVTNIELLVTVAKSSYNVKNVHDKY